MNFYKNVIEHKGKLLVRGIKDGKDYQDKIDYSPTLYALSQQKSEYKTLEGQNLNLLHLYDIKSHVNLEKMWRTIAIIYGLERYHYQYIGKNYPDAIEWSKDKKNIYIRYRNYL